MLCSQSVLPRELEEKDEENFYCRVSNSFGFDKYLLDWGNPEARASVLNLSNIYSRVLTSDSENDTSYLGSFHSVNDEETVDVHINFPNKVPTEKRYQIKDYINEILIDSKTNLFLLVGGNAYKKEKTEGKYVIRYENLMRLNNNEPKRIDKLEDIFPVSNRNCCRPYSAFLSMKKWLSRKIAPIK